MDTSKIRKIQEVLGVKVDGIWGPKTQAALDDLLEPTVVSYHGKASSFADPADILAFKQAKSLGMSDREAFEHGDNGIGVWGDDTTKGLWCALPVHRLEERWGSRDAGKHQLVSVTFGMQTHILKVGDVMSPDLSSGAIIDLSPDSCNLFGLRPPVLVPVIWHWV